MSFRREVVLSGSGGQGLGLAGEVLAQVFLKQGLNAVQNQSYGARARGGFSQSSVIASDEEIIYPFLEAPDLVIALSQKGYELNTGLLAPGGLLIYDSELVQAKGKENEKGYPFYTLSRKLGYEQGIAFLALGVLARQKNLFLPEKFFAVLTLYFQGEPFKANWRSFQTGWEIGKT